MREIFGIEFSTSEWATSKKPFAFTNREDAEAEAKGIGWFGGDGVVFTMTLYENRQDFADGELAKLKTEALKKLSEEERRALRELGV